MRILITGANGFIGSSLMNKLEKNHEVIRFAGDLLEPIPQYNNIDVCFHTAAITNADEFRKNPLRSKAVNETATENLLKMFRLTKSKPLFIFFSTLGVFSQSAPIQDYSIKIPSNAYSSSKAAGESVVKSFSNSFPCVILRPVFPYGSQSKPERLTASLIHKIRKGHKIPLNADNRPYCNPIYIDDLTTFCEKLLKLKKENYTSGCNEYNIGGPEVLSIKDMSIIIGSILLIAPIFTETNRVTPNYIADISKLYKDFNFEPKITFQEGITKMLNGDLY